MNVAEDAFANQPTIVGDRVRLEPLGIEHFDGVRQMLLDPEGRYMSGTTTEHDDDMLRGWLETRQDHDDRADFAIVEPASGRAVGEVVLNELDPEHARCNFRIGLSGPELFGRGLGTEATGLVLDYAFETVGLRRVELEVYSFNLRARRSYEKAGFVQEGVLRESLWWDGAWHDRILMGVLASDPRPRPVNA